MRPTALLILSLALLTGCSASKSSSSQPQPMAGDFPYCQPVNDVWPGQTVVVGGAASDHDYVAEVCLLQQPFADASSSAGNRLYSGGSGFFRLRLKSTGAVLQEHAFERLSFDGSIMWGKDAVWIINDGVTLTLNYPA